MGDQLVNLYSREVDALPSKAARCSVAIRPALAPELHIVTDWVRAHFSENWASEVLVAFSRQPVSCFIAVEDGVLRGFACYDATARGFFGPTGVNEHARGRGIGLALLSATLQAMKTVGYAYAVIGDPGPAGFYKKAAGAISIDFDDVSNRGLYEGMLKNTPKKNTISEDR